MTPNRHRNWLISWWGVSIGAAVAAYCAAPLLRYAEPGRLAAAGIYAGSGIIIGYDSVQRIGRKKIIGIGTATLLLTVAFVYLVVVIGDAREASNANDTRCSAIQHDMLSSGIRRADDAYMMQALACRPQGSDRAMLVDPGRIVATAAVLAPKSKGVPVSSKRTVIHQAGQVSLEQVQSIGGDAVGYVLRDPRLPGGAKSFDNDRAAAVAAYTAATKR